MKIISLIFSLLFCMACYHQPEKIISIDYTAVDSNIELTMELTIKADSILFTSINHLGTRNEFCDTTSSELWKSLMGKYDSHTFQRIKNGEPASTYAPDRTFHIKTDLKEYSFTNGEADEAYKQLGNFFTIIRDLSIKCYERSVPINM